MEVTNKVEREVMSEKEFDNYLNSTMNLQYFYTVSMFKSVGRAFRRGHITKIGVLVPKRPFHNKANTSKRKGKHSRKMNEIKKSIYEELKYKQGRL